MLSLCTLLLYSIHDNKLLSPLTATCSLRSILSVILFDRCGQVWLYKFISRTGPKTERLTILRAAKHEIELGDHDFYLSWSHYTDTDPTSRERAAKAEIELGTSSPGVARFADWATDRRRATPTYMSILCRLKLSAINGSVFSPFMYSTQLPQSVSSPPFISFLTAIWSFTLTRSHPCNCFCRALNSKIPAFDQTRLFPSESEF